MNQRFSVPLALSALLVVPGVFLAGGCLPDDPPVDGRLLHPGIKIESPRFQFFDGQPWVLFNVRRAIPQAGIGGRLDLHRVRWEDGQHEVILENWSDSVQWSGTVETRTDAEGAVFYVIDEWLPDSGPRQSIGTLVRVRHDSGPIESIRDVLTYGLHTSKEKFYYRKYLPGSPYSELHLRDLDGRDVNLGLLTRTVQFVGDDALYFIGGPTNTLFRKDGFDGLPVPLREQVAGVEIDPGQRFALISVSEDRKVRTVFLDLNTLQEKPLPLEVFCCGIALQGDTLRFAVPATAEKTAELHYYNVIKDEYERIIPMPPGLIDVQGTLARRGTSEFLAWDSRRQYAVVRPDRLEESALIPLRPSHPTFSGDGRFLVFIDEEPPPPPPAVSNTRDGKLMVQDANDWSAPPRELTPPGTTCTIEPRSGFFLTGDNRDQAVFWARFGLGSSDLFLADVVTGSLVKLADGIGAISITSASTILGVVRIGQDLTGDFVHRDFVTGQEAVLEHSVSDFADAYSQALGHIVAFVVRERNASSPRNGLWAANWKDIPDGDAGAPEAAPGAAARMFQRGGAPAALGVASSEGQGGMRKGASERPW